MKRLFVVALAVALVLDVLAVAFYFRTFLPYGQRHSAWSDALLLGPLLLPWLPTLLRRSPAAILFAVMVPLEHAAGVLAWHTLGEITSALILFALWINVLPALWLCTASPKARGFALAAAAAIAALVVPRQVFDGVRFFLIHDEATRIVTWLEAQRETEGSYPRDLAAFEFRHPWVRAHVSYDGHRERDDFRLYYFVGTPSTSHWYEPGEGWAYYPD